MVWGGNERVRTRVDKTWELANIVGTMTSPCGMAFNFAVEFMGSQQVSFSIAGAVGGQNDNPTINGQYSESWSQTVNGSTSVGPTPNVQYLMVPLINAARAFEEYHDVSYLGVGRPRLNK